MIQLSKIPPAHALNSDVAIATVKTSVNRENIAAVLRTAANSKFTLYPQSANKQQLFTIK